MGVSRFRCQIRSIRGVPGISPEGTPYLIRAVFAAGVLPAGFRVLAAELRLSVSGRSAALASAEDPDGPVPVEGEPERLVGVLLERGGPTWVVDAGGVLVEVVWSADPPRPGPRTGDRVCVELEGEARAEDVVFLGLAR